ncbi:MAG: TIGR03960 family B12-binding radical SAM protein [Acidobacteriota bacterium]
MSEPALSKILTRVEKPGRYVGGEWNEIKKRPGEADIKIALAFPDVYEIGMSYLGQKILYALLNADPSVLAESVFAPWPDYEAELRWAGVPLASLENGIPLPDFDMVGFSLLYELNYTNVLTILDVGGIPISSADRNERHPLVIAGGPAAFNPEPVAGIFDLIVLGDGEEVFPEIIAAWRGLRKRGADRATLLREMAGIEGVYVPSLYVAEKPGASPLLVPRSLGGAPARIAKRVLRSFDKSPFPEKIVVPSLRVVFDRVAMEAARGCPQNCRFCQATSLYFPHRTKDPGLVLKTVLRSLRQTGYEDSSLSALSISDYPHLEDPVRCLMGELAREKISLSLSSLRPRGLSPDLVESILKVRKTGFTLVPEAGTERLRAVINKKLTDAEIGDALTSAFSGGWKLVKLYFMVGLPTETAEDVEGIIDLVRRSLELGRSILGSPPRIHLSLSSFIPKPHTPFQWMGMENERSLAEKQRFVRAELGRWRSVEIKDHPLKTSVLEAVFSRGDRRLGRVLARAWAAGARFDSWGDRQDPALWERAFAEEGVEPADYLGPIDPAAVLPWDHIDTGLRKAHLRRELEAALRAEPSPTCLERSCGECDGCDLRFWKGKKPPFRKPSLPAAVRPPLGEASGEIRRYRAVYSKKGKARYLSHIDLIHVLQRGFRRAGVEVRKTQGFHPKMDFSYGPALPLGMEGRKEVLEFKSSFRLDEAGFLVRTNRCLPPGIRFIRLESLAPGAPSLANCIEGLAYSLDWKGEDFLEAWRAARRQEGGENAGGGEAPERGGLEGRLREFLADKPEAAGVGFSFRGGKIILRLPPVPRRGFRPQDIVSGAFGIPDPVFLLRRDDIVFKPAPGPVD